MEYMKNCVVICIIRYVIIYDNITTTSFCYTLKSVTARYTCVDADVNKKKIVYLEVTSEEEIHETVRC